MDDMHDHKERGDLQKNLQQSVKPERNDNVLTPWIGSDILHGKITIFEIIVYDTEQN